MKFFITLWLRAEDGQDVIAKCRQAMEETVKKYGNIVGEFKIPSGGRRLTVTGECEVQQGQKEKDIVDEISKKIAQITNRAVKGKVLKA